MDALNLIWGITGYLKLPVDLSDIEPKDGTVFVSKHCDPRELGKVKFTTIDGLTYSLFSKERKTGLIQVTNKPCLHKICLIGSIKPDIADIIRPDIDKKYNNVEQFLNYVRDIMKNILPLTLNEHAVALYTWNHAQLVDKKGFLTDRIKSVTKYV